MAKRITITEKMLNDVIASVIAENRKVLKVGGGQQAPSAPMPDMVPQSMPPATPDPSMGGAAPDMGGEMPMDQQDSNGMENQFDTNFDAGVEADEETDPKRYIQQLTGKLSQSLNSFNDENGPDAGLSKYVASMIIAAACKNLDEKAKKELIEKINTSGGDDDSDIPTDDSGEMDSQEPVPPEQPQGLQENIVTKKQLHELALGMCGDRKTNTPKTQKGKKSIFSGKSFY